MGNKKGKNFAQQNKTIHVQKIGGLDKPREMREAGSKSAEEGDY